jgi:hypothetical protein
MNKMNITSMVKSKKIVGIFILIFLFLIIMSPVCQANSAEPPSIIIVVPNAPANLFLSIENENGIMEGRVEKKFLETHFNFYSLGYKKDGNYTLKVTYGDTDNVIEIGPVTDSYMNVFTLDYKTLTLAKDTSGFRVWLFTIVRILLTLVIEAAIFLAFGFREKRSWLIFLAINLLTQGALNIWLNSFTVTNGYIIFALAFAEIFIFIIEIIGFLILIKEYRKLRTFIYVILANTASLFLGGYLITLLPL